MQTPRTRHEVPLDGAFSLALTATALRRVPTNVVDVITPAGEYVHAFGGARGPIVARVAQRSPRLLDVTLVGDGGAPERDRVLALVRRTLGVDRDVASFRRAAGRLPWLAPLARRLRGLKPPRYRSLWEAFVNAVVFQQVSLHSATATVRRMVVAFGAPVECDDTRLYAFPTAASVLGASDGELRAAGLSTAKIATLRRAGDAIASGALDEAELDRRPSAEIAGELVKIKGIGPWTANVMLLRGFGRLDVFPMHDSGVARNLTLVTGQEALDVTDALEALGAQRGMLYFHLLLARLEERGAIGTPSADR